MRNFALIILLLLSFVNIKASSIEKAFEALSIYDYFKAKKLFEKSLKAHPAPANYGLSKIYLNEKNPFHNPDSALVKILKAEDAFISCSASKRDKYLKIKVDSLQIQKHKQEVSEWFFNNSIEIGTLESIELFVQQHNWYEKHSKAVKIRDSLAFDIAQREHTFQAYDHFLKTYPKSGEVSEAKHQFDSLYFIHQTGGNSILDFKVFIENNPDSEFTKVAEQKLYELYLPQKTAVNYLKYIKENPKGFYVNDALRKLFYLEVFSYSNEGINDFRKDYGTLFTKDFEAFFQDQVVNSNKIIIPIKKKDKWFLGEKNQDTIKIDFTSSYDYIDSFEQGIAQVLKDDKVGFILKNGYQLIPIEYDEALSFEGKHTIIDTESGTGLINKLNQEVIASVYDDVILLNDSLAVIEKDGSYKLFNLITQTDLIETPFDEFKVEKYGVIFQKKKMNLYFDLQSRSMTIVNVGFEKMYTENSYVTKDSNNLYGVLNLKGDTILSFEYDYIAAIKNNRAVVRKDNKYGFTNSKGSIVIPVSLQSPSDDIDGFEFHDNVAKIKKKEKIGVIDSLGKELIPPIYEDLYYNSITNFPAKKRGKWGVVTHKGKMKSPYTYSYIEPLKNNYFIAHKDGSLGLLNLEGEMVMDCAYNELLWISNSILVATNQDTTTVMFPTLEVIVQEIKVKNINLVSDRYLYFYNVNGSQSIYSIEEKKYIYKELDEKEKTK